MVDDDEKQTQTGESWYLVSLSSAFGSLVTELAGEALTPMVSIKDFGVLWFSSYLPPPAVTLGLASVSPPTIFIMYEVAD